MLLTLKTQIKILKKDTLLLHNCNHYSLSEGEQQKNKKNKIVCLNLENISTLAYLYKAGS